MAITPAQDIMSIKAILDTDPYLASLGFTAKNILPYDMVDEEITKDTKAIFIYSGTPESKSDGLLVGVVYGIDVIANKSQFGDVSFAIQQVNALLNNRRIGNLHILETLDPPTKLNSPQGTFMYSMSFLVTTPIFTQIKTI